MTSRSLTSLILTVGSACLIANLCDAKLTLFMNETETSRILGIAGEVFYVRNGYLNDYALSFNVPLKNDVTDIHFNWFDESTSGSDDERPQLDYILSLSVSNLHAMYQPVVSVPLTGQIPFQASGFSVTLLCTGLLSTDVDVRILLNVSDSTSPETLSINIRRKKTCIRGIQQQTPRPLPRPSPTGQQATFVPATDNNALVLVTARNDVSDDVTNSTLFYVIVGCAVGSVVVLIVVIVVCYLVTGGFARNQGNIRQSGSSPIHANMTSYEEEELEAANRSAVTSCGLVGSDESYISVTDPQWKVGGNELTKQKHQNDLDDNELRSIFLNMRIEACRLHVTETLLKGRISCVNRALVSAVQNVEQQQQQQQVLIKAVNNRALTADKELHSMMVSGYQLTGLQHLNNLICPTIAACFDSTLHHPYWLIYHASHDCVFLKSHLDHCRHTKLLSSSSLMQIIIQLVSAVTYLHRCDVIHRDIATRNCLVNVKSMTVSLTDSALASDLFPREYHHMENAGDLVPIKWMALELLDRQIQAINFTPTSDVWSLGVTIWELLTSGLEPYAQIKASDMCSYLRHGYRLTRPYDCSKQLFNVILQCWLLEPSMRPTASQLLNNIQMLPANTKR